MNEEGDVCLGCADYSTPYLVPKLAGYQAVVHTAQVKDKVVRITAWRLPGEPEIANSGQASVFLRLLLVFGGPMYDIPDPARSILRVPVVGREPAKIGLSDRNRLKCFQVWRTERFGRVHRQQPYRLAGEQAR